MKLSGAALLALPLLISACDKTVPPPVVGPAHQFPGNQPIPTRMDPLRDPHICTGLQKNAVVNFIFRLGADGSVSNIRIVDETPKNCGFADEVGYTFRKWHFPPVLENGVPVARDTHYRVIFGVVTPPWVYPKAPDAAQPPAGG
jgi:hypothetical protein